ncbi:MAG: hypothetical protein GY849_11480 [Deltaproteobacteria bacterium]|nr:hypothetical protein [Deltaproteobacteria bacterium]
MIVSCKACGEKYRIASEKIKGREAGFKCRSCNYLITVTRDGSNIPSVNPGRSYLAVKFMFFILIALIVIYVPFVFLSIQNMSDMHQLTLQESTKIIMDSTKKTIMNQAKSAAFQVEQFLSKYPNLIGETIHTNNSLKKASIQKVGQKAYTEMHPLPGSDGIWKTWAHVRPRIIAIDIKKPLGGYSPGLRRGHRGIKGGNELRGFYIRKDTEVARMCIVPVISISHGLISR